ncbi:MAG: heparinase II/III family protein, partial [Bacteroidetes bacterium]|nr:heparinase II/III family protein [Fibrella sp.]
WNPWIMTNWLTATLLLEPDAARRSQMVHAAMQGLDIYLNGLGPEGGCDEGPSYWFAAGGCVFDALELLHSATQGKVDVYADPLIRNMASYVYKMHIDQNFFVNFADADPTLKADGLMLYRFGRQIGNDTLARFGQWAYQRHGFLLNISDSPRSAGFHHRQRQIQNLLTIGQIPTYTTPFEEVQNAWFSDVQVMTARSDKGLYVATHGGHNGESHNHNDVGDFILYAHGRPVIIDAGRGTYTAKTFSAQRYELWWTQSQFHNLPIINGLGQPVGRNYEARNVRYIPTPKSASLAMNLAAAYPAEAGVQTWNRLVTLDRPTGAVSVTDEYVLSQKPASLQEVFMTTCSADLSTAGQVLLTTPGQPGSPPASVVLRYDPKQWKVAVEPIALTAPDDESFKTKWPNQTIKRIVLTAVNPLAKGLSVFTFSMR